jgi:hypothetical protein
LKPSHHTGQQTRRRRSFLFFKGRINITGSELHTAKLLDCEPRETTYREFQATEFANFLDLFAKLTAHLATRVACRPRRDVKSFAKAVHQLHTIAMVKPGIEPTPI